MASSKNDNSLNRITGNACDVREEELRELRALPGAASVLSVKRADRPTVRPPVRPTVRPTERSEPTDRPSIRPIDRPTERLYPNLSACTTPDNPALLA